jgi:hypothetical protein
MLIPDPPVAPQRGPGESTEGFARRIVAFADEVEAWRASVSWERLTLQAVESASDREAVVHVALYLAVHLDAMCQAVEDAERDLADPERSVWRYYEQALES